MDRPLLRALGLGVKREICVRLRKRTPGRPARENQAIVQSGAHQPDRGEGPSNPVRDMARHSAEERSPLRDGGCQTTQRPSRHPPPSAGNRASDNLRGSSTPPPLPGCCTQDGIPPRAPWLFFHCRATKQPHCARPQTREPQPPATRDEPNTRARDRRPKSPHRRHAGRARQVAAMVRGTSAAIRVRRQDDHATRILARFLAIGQMPATTALMSELIYPWL